MDDGGDDEGAGFRVLVESPQLLAIVGPTASGKSALGIAVAERIGGEIVSCDSTAVYRKFDIGTDKVPTVLQRGIPHHLVDVVGPTELYSAARIPIIVGGSGLYYRALVRGLFDGPERDVVLRGRLSRIATQNGVDRLHQMVAKVDPESARRIHPRDERRLVRALEVYFLTRRSLTAHFSETKSLLGEYNVVSFALRLDPTITAARVVRRVDRQFADGLVAEVRGLLAAGVPADAHPFSGLVYRQVIEYLNGARDETATRALIVQENKKYARRQLIWFRKEPNLQWIDIPGEDPAALNVVLARAM